MTWLVAFNVTISIFFVLCLYFFATDLPILNTSSASHRLLPQMTASQLRLRSQCQLIRRTLFTHTRHQSRVANLLRSKVKHVSIILIWRRDLDRYDQGHDANRLTVPDLPILDTSNASLARSVTKLRISKYLPKMAT